MKKFLVVAVVVTMMLMATSAFATIKDSKHDLSSTSAGSVAETAANLSSCQFCHTPHLGSWPSQNGAPLWNRTINGGYSAAGSGNYQVYGAASAGVSGATNSAGSVVGAPGVNSKTCLSCHDGTLSIGTVLVGTDSAGFTINGGGVTGAGMITGATTNLTTDLRNEHPIGIAYTTAGGNSAGLAVHDGGVLAKNVVKSPAPWVTYGASNTVECGSCHDPHNTTPGQTPFLRGAKATICTDCHSAK